MALNSGTRLAVIASQLAILPAIVFNPYAPTPVWLQCFAGAIALIYFGLLFAIVRDIWRSRDT